MSLDGRARHFAARAAIAIACVLAGASPTETTRARPTPVTTVKVTATEFAFKLSRRSVPVGTTVRFVVRNRGATVHDFVLNGRRTRPLEPGSAQTISVRFARRGTFAFRCSISGHARLGMRGTFSVGVRASRPAPPPPPVVASEQAVLTRIGSFDHPVLVTAPPGDASRLFVVEQSGAVRIVEGDDRLAEPFLDLRGRVTYAGESGLLSIAFAPDYATSGLVYAFYNSRLGYGDIRISEFRRSAVEPERLDPESERVLLTIPKPYKDHNGGMLQFGSNGLLYASVGDGDPGAVNRAGAFAQRLDVLLGKILRIDPRSGDPYSSPRDNPFSGASDARSEIWAYGLRNPWRFWIDDATGDMLIGDVGSTSSEEVDIIRSGTSGHDFGWPCLEGTVVFDATERCADPVAPLVEITHDDGVCAVVGGVVLRDRRIPDLAGRYLYGDLCTGKITAVALANGRVRASGDLGLEVPAITSFGVDGLGRAYATSDGGDVFRLDPARFEGGR